MFKFRDTCIKEVVIIIGIKSNFPPVVLYRLTDSCVVKIYLIFNGN